MSGGFDHVYLSPHLDDAVWSCGGSIALQRARGERVLVVTLCTREPGPGDAPAPAFEQNAPAELVRARRAEDALAMRALGVEFEWVDQLDAIYRMPDRYASLPALTGAPAAADPLVGAVAGVLQGMPPGPCIHAPLAVGGHVDHVIVHRAAAGVGGNVEFYEDLPYAALVPGAVEQRVGEIEMRIEPALTDVSATLRQKVQAALLYASQVGDAGAAFGEGLSAYARQVGSGRPCERRWLRSGDPTGT